MKTKKFKGGVLIYRCRNCKKEYESYHVPDIQLAMIAIINNWDGTNQINTKDGYDWLQEFKGDDMTETHNCNKSEYGVADLIKGVEDK